MAIDYDGNNTKLENTTASGFGVSTWTFLAWLNIDNAGEGSSGRIFVADETGNAITIRTTSTTNIRFTQARSTNLGGWDYTYTTGVWFGIMITYDNSSTSNDPLFYKLTLGTNLALQSITVTEVFTPAGTVTAANTGYCLGNRSDQAAGMDGRIHRPRFYNRILTSEEGTSELWYPGSVTSGRVIHIDDKGTDLTGNGWAATLTSSSQADPPPDRLFQNTWQDDSIYAVSSAPSSYSFLMDNRRRTNNLLRF